MANQPKKYKKFVATAATATLVASAIVPAAFAAEFKDVTGNDHEVAINALSKAGIINGYADSTFKPNQTINRGQVVKILGRWLEAQGQEIPADWKTEQRFSDLALTAEEELVQYAALAKDAGVFAGSNGKLNYTQNMQRQQMAVVIVRAIKEIAGVDLVAEYKEKGHVTEITDLDKAFSAEQRNAIVALEYASITNVSNFRPADSVTRGQFASFLYRTIENVLNAETAEASVKAINATTVEVTFGEEVTDVKALDFAIDGLEVKNAVVKQTNKKVVVLTTEAQTADKEYTVTLDGDKIGTFKGVSAVIPTKVVVETDAVQGVVGKQVTLKADIGVKEAGVPVTFNVKAAINSLNKDQVEEVLTDANGIATFTYTQYNAGFADEVAVYATGAPAVRDFATIWWGVDSILTLEEDDKKGNSLNNGENKVYKITYKNPKTGKPVENETVHLTFVENVNINVNQLSDATVNGVTPYQLNNGRVQEVTVKTDSKGEATVTVSGTNAKATLVAFIDNNGSTATEKNKLERTELQVRASEVTFGAIQTKYAIEVTRDGEEEAAKGLTNGRVYKVVVKDEEGKAAAGEVVNVAFDEILDNVIATKTNAVFVEDADLKGDRTFVTGSKNQQITLKLDSKGEGEFQIATADGNNKDYATPVVWLDINSSSNKEGTLENGEPNKVAGITYFAEEKVTGSKLKVYQLDGTEIKDNRTQDGNQAVYFNYTVANQSGETYASSVRNFKATFQVTNTGSEDVYVWTKLEDVGNFDKATVISTRRGETFTLPTVATNGVRLYVASKGESASVDVKSYGQAEYQDHNNEWKTARLSESKIAKATFKSTSEVGNSYQGTIAEFDKDKKKFTFDGKKEINYKSEFDDKKVKYFDQRSGKNVEIGASQFEDLIFANKKANTVQYFKNSNGEITFTILSIGAGAGTGATTIEGAVASVNNARNAAAIAVALANVPEFKALTSAQQTAVANRLEAILLGGSNVTAAAIQGAITTETSNVYFTAAYTDGVASGSASKGSGSLTVETSKSYGFETATAGASTLEGAKINFVLGTTTQTDDVEVTYDGVAKVLTVALKAVVATPADPLAGTAEVLAAKSGILYSDITAAVTGYSASFTAAATNDVTTTDAIVATQFIGKTITIAGSKDAVAAQVDAKLVLTFSEAVQITTAGSNIVLSYDVDGAGATPATTATIAATDYSLSADGLVLTLSGANLPLGLTTAATVTGATNVSVKSTGKSLQYPVKVTLAN